MKQNIIIVQLFVLIVIGSVIAFNSFPSKQTKKTQAIAQVETNPYIDVVPEITTVQETSNQNTSLLAPMPESSITRDDFKRLRELKYNELKNKCQVNQLVSLLNNGIKQSIQNNPNKIVVPFNIDDLRKTLKLTSDKCSNNDLYFVIQLNYSAIMFEKENTIEIRFN